MRYSVVRVAMPASPKMVDSGAGSVAEVGLLPAAPG
jgi:hypothetical protein